MSETPIPRAPKGSNYDYLTALQRLQGLVQRLEERGVRATDAAAPAPSQVAATLRFWRGNWRSLLALLTLYSIPTAAVTALFFAERQKQVCIQQCLRLVDFSTVLFPAGHVSSARQPARRNTFVAVLNHLPRSSPAC